MNTNPIDKAVTIHLVGGGESWGILVAQTSEGATVLCDDQLTFYPTQQIRRITWEM